jgi:hypothetical protein
VATSSLYAANGSADYLFSDPGCTVKELRDLEAVWYLLLKTNFVGSTGSFHGSFHGEGEVGFPQLLSSRSDGLAFMHCIRFQMNHDCLLDEALLQSNSYSIFFKRTFLMIDGLWGE